MTAKRILKDFLSNKLKSGDNTVSSHEFEVDLVAYGKTYWGVLKLPSAYSREWRKIRQEDDLRDIDILEVIELETDSPEATWQLKTL